MLATLANDIAQIVTDYRNHDGIQITAMDVLDWVGQFDAEDRTFMLEELKHIFDKRYIAKADATQCLKVIVEKLTEDKGYKDVQSFLADTVFLQLQEPGKSQTDIINLMGETIKAEYNFDIENCGTRRHKYYVYLDDLLCTGNTAFLHTTRWLSEEDEDGNSHLKSLQYKRAELIFAYLIIHRLNYNKLKARFKRTGFIFNYNTYRFLEVENNYDSPIAKLDFVFPIQDGQPQQVMDYFSALGVDASGVFRKYSMPKEETFFSSPENRIRFENILLIKGLEILESVSSKKENIRPLGFTLPSHKNLGFGTLCFTWRNIANNVPLVFWYSSAHWQALFEKKTYNVWSNLDVLF